MPTQRRSHKCQISVSVDRFNYSNGAMKSFQKRESSGKNITIEGISEKLMQTKCPN
jgi:hypothetical protein